MDEETQEGKSSASILSRHRSPTFSKTEVQTLISIVEKYKYTILNKSTNTTVNQAKDLCWEKIAKIFNSKGFKYERSSDSLKTKWENLKRDARKVARNLVDKNSSSYNNLSKQIVAMMIDVEKNAPADGQNMDDDAEFHELVANNEKLGPNLKRNHNWENFDEKESDESNDGDDEKRSHRSLNFAPQECSLLLKCVRNEKKYIFTKEYNAHAIGLKNNAWKRIAEAFNKNSPQKRSQKVLRTKFNNMKSVVKCMGIKDAVKSFDRNNTKHEKLVNESSKQIKSEPLFEMELEVGPDLADFDRHNSDSNQFAPDPLGTVLNSDSGIGSTHSSSWSHEHKDIVKLKSELLNYKIETAKLERQRLEEMSRAEAAARDARAVTSALELRTARLQAVAAAAILPRDHPALLFTPEEQPAERYLRQYEHT